MRVGQRLGRNASKLWKVLQAVVAVTCRVFYSMHLKGDTGASKALVKP